MREVADDKADFIWDNLELRMHFVLQIVLIGEMWLTLKDKERLIIRHASIIVLSLDVSFLHEVAA